MYNAAHQVSLFGRLSREQIPKCRERPLNLSKQNNCQSISDSDLTLIYASFLANKRIVSPRKRDDGEQDVNCVIL